MGRGLLVQMAGHAGSGKSRVARQLGGSTGAAVLDLDPIKSALLESGVDWERASTGSYAVIYALVDELLSVGGRVVVDTPSYWPEIHARLTAAADAHAATYVFVECDAEEAVRARRLDRRAAQRSQVTGLDSIPVDAPPGLGVLHHRQIQRPDGRRCVVVRTDRGVDLRHLLGAAGLLDFVRPSGEAGAS